MAIDFSDPVVRARSLAQGLPLSEEAHRFLNRAVAEERLRQPYPDIGIWAGHALTVGYALRRVEEEDTAPRTLPDDLTEDPDRVSDLVAEAIRSAGYARTAIDLEPFRSGNLTAAFRGRPLQVIDVRAASRAR